MNATPHEKVTMRGLREEDFAYVASKVDEWWGRPVRGSLLRPFYEHFRPMSHVAEQAGAIAGFIVGFHSQSHPSVAYARFIAVRPEERRSGVYTRTARQSVSSSSVRCAPTY